MYPVKNIVTKLNLTTNELTTESTVVNDREEHFVWLSQFKHLTHDDNSIAALYNDELISADSKCDSNTNTVYFFTAIFTS